MKQIHSFMYVALLFFATSMAISQSLVPVGSALSGNQVSYTSNTNFDIGSINDVFDGNTSSLARTPSVNPLVITLTFPVAFPLVKSRIMSATDADWSLEVATTLSDLNAHAGSYAKVVNTKITSGNVWGEAVINSVSMKFARLTVHRTVGDDYVHLNEWELYSPTPTITSMSICPGNYYLAPGYSKNYTVSAINSYGFKSTITSGITWTSSASSIATVSSGLVNALAVGTTTISASYQGFNASSTLTVGRSFTPVKAAKKTVKVALLMEDPFIPGSTSVRWHSRFGWGDPLAIATELIQEMNAASDNTVEFVLTTSIYGNINFTNFDGAPTDSSFFYHRYETEQGLNELLYWAGHLSGYRLKYDYTAMLNYYNFCQMRESGAIDEVWVMSHPAGGMYESRLAGPNAFWYNSPPVEVSSCVKLLPIMGFNMSVGVDNAMHSIGHRVESTMAQVYKGWNSTSEVPVTPFDLFTWLDKDHTGKSNVGNIHFAPNSLEDYEYSSSKKVINFADNWSHYPLLGNSTKEITCSEWGCSQAGYMRWWFNHLPKYQGITDGVLNDWWNYIVHYEDAQVAASSQGCGNALPFTTVTGSNSAPSISINTPMTGTVYTAPASIQITALTGDVDGFVSKVEFFNGGTKIGESLVAPFVYSWTGVLAGTYTITAKATDNNGATTVSVGVVVTVNPLQAQDIYGPTCSNINKTITYTLDASHRANAYGYSWWFNGYTQSITPVIGQPYSVVVNTGAYFTSGQICVGINYSAAPWYRSFCKSVSVCPLRTTEDLEAIEASDLLMYPNPCVESFNIRTTESVQYVEVLNNQGILVISKSVTGEDAIGTRDLASGIYTVVIHYSDGRQVRRKLSKL